ncbi:MAG TPA: cytochrome P450 [Polyangia bacterium]|nr:cytochrome P450 [Polyangia bacterium]
MSTAVPPASSSRAIAPGPKGHPLFGMLPEFRGDRLSFLVRTARTYGAVARFMIRNRSVFLVSDPAGVKRVLQDNADNYGRKTRSVDALKETLGNGLLTTTGPPWWRNRRLAQPSFHKQRLAGFAGIMASSSADFVERLARTGGGGDAARAPVDIVPEMSRLTLRILGLCLFDRDLTDEADAVGGALQVVLHHTIDKLAALFPLPGAVPTPKNLRFRAALRALDRVVLSLIAERRRDGADRGDLLSMLLAARDEDTGEGLSDRQLRDEVMTLLLAGHETTAMALSWTFYLLSLHPGARRTLEKEVDAAPPGGGNGNGAAGAGPGDLARLRYTRMVLDEALRLYPPAWVVTRSADAPDEIGGFAIPAGSRVLVSPYVTQHDPALWDDPEGFDPERFAPEADAGRPRYAYFPFGGGPHLCIGAGFATMEATIVLATVARRLRLDLEPGRPVTIDPLVTLRPKPGIFVTARPR